MDPNTNTAQNQNPVTPASPQSVPPPPPAGVPPPPKEYIPPNIPVNGFSSFFSKKKIISFVIGIIVVLGMIAGIFLLILPRLGQNSNKNVTLTYWGLWEEKEVFGQLISDFERLHPSIKIQYEKQDIKNLSQYLERLKTRIKSGTGPDIYRFHNSWTSQLQGYLLALPNSVTDPTGLKDKYFPVVRADVGVNGALFGLPLGIDTLSLFVNDDIVKAGGYKYPTDWDYLIDLARLTTVIEQQEGSEKVIKTSGLAMGTYDNVAHSADIVALLFAQSGVTIEDLISPDEASSQAAQKRAATALDYYTCFAKDTNICQKVWNESMENSRLAFAKGKAAMMFGYSWDILEIKAINPQLNFSVHPVPHLTGRKQTIASYWVEGVSSNTKAQKEAYEFMAFLGSRESLEKLYTDRAKLRTLGLPFPRSDMANLLQSNAILKPIMDQAENSQSTYFSSDTYDGGLDTELSGYLADAVRAVVMGQKSSESAIESLTTALKAKFGQNGKK